MTKDTVRFKETKEGLEVVVNINSIKPCLESIKQYIPQFKPQDITKSKKYISMHILETINENFEDYLFTLIHDNRDITSQKYEDDINAN